MVQRSLKYDKYMFNSKVNANRLAIVVDFCQSRRSSLFWRCAPGGESALPAAAGGGGERAGGFRAHCQAAGIKNPPKG